MLEIPVTQSFASIGAVVTGLVACVTDVRTRRIPNLLTVGSALAGVAAHAALLGPGSALWSVAGCALGLALFLPLFLLRGMGGGDVKLLAALGAWLGPRLVLWTGLYGAIAGGVLALLLSLSQGVLRQTAGNVGLLLTTWRVNGIGPVDGLTLETSKSPRLPYALPLTCGLLVALWLKS